MVPTIPWMRDKFAAFNSQYFGGRLPTPELAVEPLNQEWGKYDVEAYFYKNNRKIFRVDNNGKITLTSSFDRDEDAIIATLLHEMIHEYVYLILRVYPENPHGQEFMSIANQMIADGWDIEEVTFRTDKDAPNNSSKTSVVLIVSKPRGTDYKYWICKVNPEDCALFKSTASKIPDAKFDFYEIAWENYDALQKAISDPQYLTGWGGMTFDDVIKQIAQFTGLSSQKVKERVMCAQRYVPGTDEGDTD